MKMSNNYMTVYAYNPETLEYTNPISVQENPKHPGQYLVPPENTTDAKPPVTDEKEVAVISSDHVHWEIRPDYRGTVYYLPDGSKHTIDRIGDTLPEHALLSPPEPTLEDVAKDKSIEVRFYADNLIYPISYVYPVAEMRSWDKQEIEARIWDEWNNIQDESLTGLGDIEEPATPLLDQILKTREDQDKEKLVNSIIEKADAYIATGQVFGVRHNLDKQIYSIVIDQSMSDDEKKAAISAIDVQKSYSICNI